MIPELEGTFSAIPGPHRFVIVNDGSRDRTAEVAAGLAKDYPVVLASHPVNLGVAKAFDTGLRLALRDAAPEDLIFTMEGDRTNDPACIPEMVRLLRAGRDIVLASRYHPGGSYIGFPLKRRVLSVGANLLARVFFRIPGVKDYTIFYRGYRASALQRALEAYGERFIECRGFASNAEILVKAAKAGPLDCAEVAMIYRYDLK
ncbi:MAG: glycosyltransferase, partial [Elusimicrobia bacterium]|nr:glycosyltransferase [Elusimicrobiota bacterium]